jgi:Beta-lactamase
VHGNGGLLTTVGDLLIWNASLDNGLLGKPELTSLLQTRGKLTSGRELDYALGLGIGELRAGIREVGHGGSTAGYRTYLARYPDAQRLSVALLCNAANANATALARRVANVFLPAPPVASAPAITAPPAAERSRILGSYRHPVSDAWFVISGVGEHARLTGVSGDTLIYRGAGDFVTRDSTRYRFEPASGAVQRVTRTTSDGETTAFEAMPRLELSAEQLKEFAAEYFSPELRSTIRLRADSGRLILRSSPDEEVNLVPLYRDGFRVGASPATVRFVRDGSGRIKEVRVFAGRARNVLFERINNYGKN